MKRWLTSRRGRNHPAGPVSDDGRSALLDGLYHDHYKELCKNINSAFGPGPPEPEDVVQAAFLKFAALKDPFTIRDPRSFLFITARNLILDHKRRSKLNNAYLAEQIALDQELMLEEITPERVVLAKDYFARLVAAIRTLPRKQRIVLAMNRIEGKTYTQIRAETGWSSADISRQMSAGMEALVLLMEADPQMHHGRDEPQTRPDALTERNEED